MKIMNRIYDKNIMRKANPRSSDEESFNFNFITLLWYYLSSRKSIKTKIIWKQI